MWPTDDFQGNEDFQQDQANFQHSYSDDGYIPFSPAGIGQQIFQKIKSTQGILYNDFVDSEHSTPGAFEPEIGLYNEDTYAHSHFRGSDSLEEYTPERQGIIAQGTPRPILNARAEELKAQLLKSKERAKSGTPPISIAAGPKPPNSSNGPKQIREPPKSIECPDDEVLVQARRTPVIIDDADFDDLISQAQAVPNVKRERIQGGSNPTKPHGNAVSESAINSQIHTAESTAKFGTPDASTDSNAKLARHKVSREESNGHMSDVSEGEIQEDSRTTNDTPQLNTSYKETQNTTGFHKHNESMLYKAIDERNRKTVNSHEIPETSLHRESSVTKSRANPPRLDGRYEDTEERVERRSRQTNEKYESKHQPESEKRPYPRRDNRGSSDVYHRLESSHETDKEEMPSRKPETPTLAQLLLIDEDLKDWLVVTGYHNAEYRNKILNRRRAIAALDAQKAKLLEEMEIEERGGVPPVTKVQISATGMLPPPIPSKMGAVASSIKKTDDMSIPMDKDRIPSTALSQDSAIKRSFTEYREPQNEGGFNKVGPAEDRGRGMGFRIKSSSQSGEQRPYSNGPDSSRRRSTSDDNETLHRDTSDSNDDNRGRDRARVYARQRAFSPEEGYDRSPPGKMRKHELSPSDDRDDHSEWKTRPFVMRGNYRGRAYDPNYRGRGRGRGNWNELGEGRFERRESLPSQPFAQRLAFMKPYKDPQLLDLGRRGDTKYFIVKSFNEENVVRCIEDSIWTTQVENGEIFKAAFLKHKNVILVFSVNQSRAFQGYARMESVPGSEETPKWQNNINWESAGAFKVRWICVANTRFHRVGHIKNRLNENQAVLVGRDGQEIEEFAGEELLRLIDEEADRLLTRNPKDPVPMPWDD